MAITKKVDLCELWTAVQSGKKRLPKDESVWLSDGKFAFLYAKYFRKARWSEVEEICFYGDVKALYNYSYWLVTDLNDLVPEHLHNFMLAKVLDNVDRADKEWIDLYFKNIKKSLIKK